MTTLSPYSELTTIQLFDSEILSPIPLNDFEPLLQNDSKFIRIGNQIIAKNQIKKVFVRKVSDSESLLYLLEPQDRKLVQQRLKQMEERSGIFVENISKERMQRIIRNVLENKEKN